MVQEDKCLLPKPDDGFDPQDHVKGGGRTDSDLQTHPPTHHDSSVLSSYHIHTRTQLTSHHLHPTHSLLPALLYPGAAGLSPTKRYPHTTQATWQNGPAHRPEANLSAALDKGSHSLLNRTDYCPCHLALSLSLLRRKCCDHRWPWLVPDTPTTYKISRNTAGLTEPSLYPRLVLF